MPLLRQLPLVTSWSWDSEGQPNQLVRVPFLWEALVLPHRRSEPASVPRVQKSRLGCDATYA
jgi:hypothetical protein